MAEPTKAELLEQMALLHAELAEAQQEVAEAQQEADDMEALLAALPEPPPEEPDPSPVPVPPGTVLTGTSYIGDMSTGGGLDAAFDGNLDQPGPECASKFDTVTGWLGLSLSGQKRLTAAIVHGASDNGFVSGGNPVCTLELYGKAGAAPTSGTDGTLLGSVTFTDRTDGAPVHVPSSDTNAVWDHAWVRVVKTTAGLTALRVGEVKLYVLDPLPPPSTGNLEPINGSALQVAISVEPEPRQTWRGAGWGAGGITSGSSMLTKVQAHLAKLSTGLNASLVRFHTPEVGSTFVNNYKPIWDVLKTAGFDTVFSSSYMYTTRNQGGTRSPTDVANGIAGAISAGIDPELWFCTLQNEPDGGTNNRPYGSSDFDDRVMADHEELWNRVQQLGLGGQVKVLGLEWRHTTDINKLRRERDRMAATGRLHMLYGGLYHCYNKGPDNECYDNRWKQDGKALLSAESGDLASPRAVAEFITGLNHGAIGEIAHIGISTSTNDGDLKQKLYDANGNALQWTPAWASVSKALIRGTVMQLCLSSDRPTGMGTTQAIRMLWNSATSQRQPRQQVAFGARPDGKKTLVACSYAYGSDAPTTFAGGHYAAVTQQLTVSGVGTGTKYTATKTTMAGAQSAVSYDVVDGQVRFTLAPGEAIAGTIA